MPDKVEEIETVKAETESDSMKQENTTCEKNSNGVTEENTNEKNESVEKNAAMALLAQGKRHLFVKDYPSAATTLGEACGKLGEIYGDLADECGDAYFNYGRALLELSREETNALVEKESEIYNDTEGNEAESKEDEDEDEEAEDNEENEDKPNDDKTGESKSDDEDEKATDENEDVNSLQLAWEVFELAKIIFHRQNNEAKLAETYLYLGEVSLESENYSNAIDDMKKCLDLQKKILAEDNRDIAETLFQLGVACSYDHMFDESKAYFREASDILEIRIKNLQSGCQPDDANTKNPFYSVEKEIEEIKAILPEIKEKIDDVDDLKKETLKSMMDLAMKGGSSSEGAGSSNGSAVTNPATNISHLIKKKRKPEEDIAEGAKKPCTEEKPLSS